LLVHLLLKQLVKPGDRVVDATCGNGKDTLFLAELVGEDGQVVAFDIQKSAIKRSAARLKEAGLDSRVTLLFAGHEEMARLVAAPLSAVVFNLGWLPGGDRELKTCAGSTLPALKAPCICCSREVFWQLPVIPAMKVEMLKPQQCLTGPLRSLRSSSTSGAWGS